MTLQELSTPLEGARAHSFQRESLKRLGYAVLALAGLGLVVFLLAVLYVVGSVTVFNDKGLLSGLLPTLHQGIRWVLDIEDVLSRHFIIPLVLWMMYLYGFAHMIRASNKAAALHFETSLTNAQAKWLRPRVNRFNRYWLLGDLALFFALAGALVLGLVKTLFMGAYPVDWALTGFTAVLCLAGAVLRTTTLYRFFLHPEVMALITLESRNISGQRSWSASHVSADEVFFTIGTTVLQKHARD